MKAFFGILFALTLALVISAVALAQGTEPGAPTDDQVNRIAKQMYCPVCENTPLDVCPTQACAEWRELIRDKLAQGWTEEQIKAYFVDQFGDRVLAEPPRRGLNWLVYVIPPLAFLAGTYLLFRAFRAWRKPVVQATSGYSAPPPPEDEYVKRLEEELHKL